MENPEQLLLVMGTRPEAIKLAGLARALGDRARILHTGQHYDKEMWHDVLSDLAGVDVTDHITIGGRTRGEQIGDATSALTRYLLTHPVRAVVVQGDTNSTLAGGLAASAVGVPLIHVEAGLRSHDRRMPEELNRILTDAVADLCCAPIPANAEQLRREGVTDDRILVTGNTLADALGVLAANPEESALALDQHGIRPGEYALVTVHRAGTVDDRVALACLMEAFATLAQHIPVVLPLHPRTGARLADFGLQDSLGDIRVTAPLAPKEFMALEASAGLIVSDSGGVQEEACLFRRPLLVVRDSTERPELLDGWCRLLGDSDPRLAVAEAWADAREWADDLATRPLPYGAPDASNRILTEIDRRWPVGQTL